MSQMNLFDLLENDNFGGEGFDFLSEPLKDEKKKKNSKVTSSTSIAMEVTEEEDEEEDTLCLEEGSETSAEKKKKPSKKKKSSLTGESLINLPITCYGRNWKVTIEEFGSITLNQLLEKLYLLGIKEVAHKDINPIMGDFVKEGKLYFTSPQKESKTNIAILRSQGETLFLDGMEHCPMSIDNFTEMEMEEVSLLDGMLLFEKQFPQYTGCDISFCSGSRTGIPVIAATISDQDEIPLPLTINVSGQLVTLECDSVSGDTVTGKYIRDEFFSDTSKGLLTLKRLDSTVYGEYTGTVATNMKKPGDSSTGGEIVVEEFYHLPCKLYFATLNIELQLQPEMFSGQDKIRETELLSHLKQRYPILRNKDRKIEVFYSRKEGVVSVALTSGTKG